MENILISVITPSFNSEKTIVRCIESVLRQTYENIEFIIIDGGSTDQTIEIIKSYIPKFKGRLKYISEKDNGIYDAMNKGIKMCSGELIGILSSNDYYELDGIEKIIGEYNPQKPLSILYGMERLLVNDKESQVRIFHHQFMKTHMITHPATFVAKSVYDKYGLYDLNYKSSSDYDFMLRMIQIPEINFIPVYKLVTNFNAGGISSTPLAGYETLKLRKNYNLISNREYITGLIWNRFIYALKLMKIKG